MAQKVKMGLTLEKRDEIAKHVIDIVNKYNFSDRGISSSNMRNLLDFINGLNVTPNLFNLFCRYQAARSKEDEYRKFTNDFLTSVQKFCNENNFKSIDEKIYIYREYLINIVMGGTFRKKNVKEKIEII